MKALKKMFLYHICLLTVLCLLTASCFLQARRHASGSVRQELSDRLLRFRVLANSDSAADQEQKNRVSQALASSLRPLLSDCSSKEEAVSLLSDSLAEIEKKAAALAALYGNAYPVSCTLSSHCFPIKIYQDLTFPAGEYDTLLVTIGDGAGSNWWCLAYPPLCFTEESYVTVPGDTRDTLKDILSEETYEAVSQKSGTPSFCFRLFPFLNRLFCL